MNVGGGCSSTSSGGTSRRTTTTTGFLRKDNISIRVGHWIHSSGRGVVGGVGIVIVVPAVIFVVIVGRAWGGNIASSK